MSPAHRCLGLCSCFFTLASLGLGLGSFHCPVSHFTDSSRPPAQVFVASICLLRLPVCLFRVGSLLPSRHFVRAAWRSSKITLSSPTWVLFSSRSHGSVMMSDIGPSPWVLHYETLGQWNSLSYSFPGLTPAGEGWRPLFCCVWGGGSHALLPTGLC